MKVDNPSRWFSVYFPCAIALIVFLVFSPAIMYDFVNLDDPVFVYKNPNVLSGLSLESIKWAFTNYTASNWIPLTWILHILTVQIFGLNPAGHHFINIILHVGNCILLYIFLRKSTGAPIKSATVALMFGLHPLHIESVAWVSEAKDVLSTFFWMLTLVSYAYYCEKPGISRYLISLGLFLLGGLSKSMVVTLPVVLILLDWWPLSRFDTNLPQKSSGLRSVGRLCLEKIPFLLISAIVSIITYSVHRTTGDMVTSLSFFEKAGRACVSYVEYIRRMVWPSKLTVFYPFVGTPPSGISVLISLILLLLMSLAALLLLKRAQYVFTGWFWYLVTLLPVIGLIQVGDHAITDRYSYIPLIGLFIALVWGGANLSSLLHLQRTTLSFISGSLLVVLTVLTSMQLRYWKNSITLLTRAIEVTDNNWLALNNLGQAYLDIGKVDEAVWCFSEAVKAKPTYVIALVNLGAMYSLRNDRQQAFSVLSRALMLDPGNEKARILLGLLLPE